MCGDRAIRVGVLMLLCLLPLTSGEWQCKPCPCTPVTDDQVRQVIANAEAAKATNQAVSKAYQELVAELARHAETMKNIIARGPPEMLVKIQPSYENTDALIANVKQGLLGLKEENDLMELSLARAKREFGHLLERDPKDEL